MVKEIVLFLGFGYVANYAAEPLFDSGYHIYGTSRSTETRAAIENKGYGAADFSEIELAKILPDVSHIVISIPPQMDLGDPSLAKFSELIARHRKNIKSIIYLSTTGVYGNHDGNWVDEESTLKPEYTRNKLRLQAEQDWQEFGKKYDINVKIFRLSGIYGPGRNALAQVQSGRARSILKQGQVFSRIHVQDIANIIKIAITERPNLSGIFNLADDHPASTIEVNNYAASLLEVEEPPIIGFEEADLSPMAKEFYSHNRRVSNKKIKEFLGIKLLYPDYKSGLKSMYQKGEFQRH